ncbi:MAG: DUF2635 domain-containing protein [Desulfovibrionaceae bacterium]
MPNLPPDTITIKPVGAVLLRNPATGESIPPEGATVTLGPHRIFWLRRIQDGDAVECHLAKIPPKAKE